MEERFETAKAKAIAWGFTFGNEFSWEWQDTEEDDDGKEREVSGTARAIKVSYPPDYPCPPYYLITTDSEVDRTRTINQLIAVYASRFEEHKKLEEWNRQVEVAMERLKAIFRGDRKGGQG